jgi:hypothetical protein
MRDENHLKPYRRGIMESIRRGQTPLDPRLNKADRRQALWATDNLLERGMIQVAFRVTPKGLDALAPKPRVKSEGNPNLNARRRDKCFRCASRTCHLRIFLPDGAFDELACDVHIADLHTHAESKLNVAQKQIARIEESEGRLRRERLSSP